MKSCDISSEKRRNEKLVQTGAPLSAQTGAMQMIGKTTWCES
jgi:hypothetical protein